MRRAKRVISVLLVCALFSGCASSLTSVDTTAKKVAALEAKVETLEKRNSDLALKGRIVSSQLFSSGLDRVLWRARVLGKHL